MFHHNPQHGHNITINQKPINNHLSIPPKTHTLNPTLHQHNSTQINNTKNQTPNHLLPNLHNQLSKNIKKNQNPNPKKLSQNQQRNTPTHTHHQQPFHLNKNYHTTNKKHLNPSLNHKPIKT